MLIAKLGSFSRDKSATPADQRRLYRLRKNAESRPLSNQTRFFPRFIRVCRKHMQLLAMVFAVLMPLADARTHNSTQKVLVSWEPAKLVNGSPVLFRVSSGKNIQSVVALWLGHDVIFFPETTGRFWYALAGVPVETHAGKYDLLLTETLAGGKPLEIRRKIRIAVAVYPKIKVKVAKQYTEPSPEQIQQIDADKELKQKIFATQNPQRLWVGQFQPPATAEISDVFGTERVFNQEVQSRHLGLDYAVPAGTPVHAVNRGTVILARPLFFEGNCVVVDHGQGLLSLYLHLSEFRVKEGEQVDSGTVIGLSGGSGRVTGPHLHLAIRWQGVYLNPAILLKIKTP
jgi:peptidase M23-like protein